MLQKHCPGKPGATELKRKVILGRRIFLSEKLFLPSELRMSLAWTEYLVFITKESLNLHCLVTLLPFLGARPCLVVSITQGH